MNGTHSRKFQESHPWLKFNVNLERASSKLWLALGEVRSKCEHIAGVPLTPRVAEDLHQIYLAKGVWATTAIEGNTLTEKNVRDRIKGRLKLPKSQEYLGQEIDNVVQACNQILENVDKQDFVYLRVDAIKAFNRQVLQGLELEKGVVPGEIPLHNVGVADYLGAPREDCDYLLSEMCRWLNDKSFMPKDDNQIIIGVLRAVLAHLYLVWIHPFGDGNGRTSRLLEYKILLSAGVPSPAAHLLSNHYNQTRPEYYRQLQASSHSNGDVSPFLEYAVSGFVEGLKAQIDLIRDFQWFITWHHYIHDHFKQMDSPTDTRRRHLVLDLSAKEGFTPMQDILSISPRVATDYIDKTTKTLTRDLNYLIQMRLVERTSEGYRARREEILQFLPLRRTEPQSEHWGGLFDLMD